MSPVTEWPRYARSIHVVVVLVGATDGDPVALVLHPDSAASIVPPKSTPTIGRLRMSEVRLRNGHSERPPGPLRGHTMITGHGVTFTCHDEQRGPPAESGGAEVHGRFSGASSGSSTTQRERRSSSHSGSSMSGSGSAVAPRSASARSNAPASSPQDRGSPIMTSSSTVPLSPATKGPNAAPN